MELNEHILKISSAGVNIPEALELSRRYLINAEIDITDIRKIDNQDGTFNFIYTGRQTGQTQIMFDGGKVIKAKDKGSISKALHGAIWHYHNENGFVEEFDEYYKKVGKKIISYLPEIIKFLESKN